jgi:hypothetical protein
MRKHGHFCDVPAVTDSASNQAWIRFRSTIQVAKDRQRTSAEIVLLPNTAIRDSDPNMS